MHGQQSQAFGQQQAFSQQISSRMPSPYPGLGATGMGGGFGNYSGYNYGNNFNSYGPGNSFGNTMTSAIGGIGHAVGSGMGIAGGVGGFMMGGVGGAMMGFMGGGIVGAGIKHIAGSFMEGAHEQSALERTLSQFQFQNAAASGGKGFTRSDSMQIGNMVRQMERMPEMLTSFGELNRLMDKMGQMGLMQGVRDAGEFMRKFRDTTNTLKDMAKMMGTTMEGALKTFQEARMSGMYNQNDISRNVLQRQVVAGATGMNQSQIGGLQMYGAEMAHSLGGSRRGGAANMLRTAGQLGMANQMGILSNDQIMEMTGKEGAEGIQDLSANMAQLSYKMGRSNVGQALTLALGKQENGRYTGEMDQELVERVRRGELSLSELKSMARSKAGTRGAKLSFAAHKDRLRTEMAGAVGSEGIAMQLQEILGNRGWDNPDATNLVMQRFGASEEQANLLQQMMPNLQGIGNQMALAGKQEARNSARTAGMAEHGWDAIKHKIGTKLKHYTTDWAKDLGVGVRDYFQNWADDFMDDITGQYREYVTKRVADTVKYSMGGSVSNRASLSGMSERAFKLSGLGGSRLDVGALSQKQGGAFQLSKELGARAMHFLSGDQTAGERAADFVGGFSKGEYLQRAQASELEQNGYMVLKSNYLDRAGVGMSSADVKAALSHADYLSSDKGGLQQFSQAVGIGGSGADSALRQAYQQAVTSADVQMEGDQSKREEMIWKKMRSALPKDVLSKLEKSKMGRHEIVAGVQAAERKAGNKFAGAADLVSATKGVLGNLDLNNQREIGQRIEKMNDRLGKSLTATDTQASWAEVKKLMDDGSQMTALLLGDSTHRGLVGSGNIFQDMATNHDMRIRNLAGKRPGDWTPEDLKTLKEMGVDATRLAAEINKNPDAWKRIQGAAQSGKLNTGDIASYLVMSDRSGLNKISQDLNRQGSDLAVRLKDNKAARDALLNDKSGKGKAVLDALDKLGGDLQKVTGENISKFTDSTGQIAGMLSGMSGADREKAFQLGGEELRQVYALREEAKGKLHKGMSIDSVLSAGRIKLGDGEADQNFKKDLQGLLHGKGGTLDDKDIGKVLDMISGRNAGELRARAGTEGNSAYMSEQDISNSLKLMSENNLKASQILADLATGQKVGTTASQANK